jgi:hypothetical protein
MARIRPHLAGSFWPWTAAAASHGGALHGQFRAGLASHQRDYADLEARTN